MDCLLKIWHTLAQIIITSQNTVELFQLVHLGEIRSFGSQKLEVNAMQYEWPSSMRNSNVKLWKKSFTTNIFPLFSFIRSSISQSHETCAIRWMRQKSNPFLSQICYLFSYLLVYLIEKKKLPHVTSNKDVTQQTILKN